MKNAIHISAIFIFAATAVFSAEARAAKVDVDASVETGDVGPAAQVSKRVKPGFRTDLGAHIAFGGHSCLAGGSQYAECRGTRYAWDTSVGFAAGVLVRPTRLFSLGIDFSYGSMKFHSETGSNWRDISLAPVAMGYIPVELGPAYFEVNLGLSVGWVQGKYNQAKYLDSNTNVDYSHIHSGIYLVPLIAGFNYFPIPKLGFGIEFRVIATLYTEVCFESSSGTSCRGAEDKANAKKYDLNSNLPGNMPVANYPVKLFWGVHGIYYF